MSDIKDLARGKWPDLLAQLGGLTAEQLTDTHQPCPCCGGTDRYRFDDIDGSGSWYCNQCGGKDGAGGGGTGMDLLMRRNGWSFAEAAKRVEQHLGIARPKPAPPLPRGKQFWQYSSDFYVVRKDKPDGDKDILPLWWDGSSWKWKAPPAPRPLYGKRQLTLKPNAPVLVVEGEKAADAAASLFPQAVVITWPSGCKAAGKADWSPLAGRKVTLWPDADAVGRDAMAKLAIRLLKLGATQVRIVQPPADVPEGWDLADATWSPAEAAAYLRANRSAPIELPALAAPDTESDRDPIPEPAPLPKQGEAFTCLGFDNDAYFYQPNSTGQVIRLGRASHTGTNLCAIAPIEYWQALYPSRTGTDWTSAASSLFELQSRIGIYDPHRIRGRGAWRDQGQSVLHLGDRLIIGDRSVPSSTGIDGSAYIYQRLARLTGPGTAKPLSRDDAYILCGIAERFRWEVPVSGLLLAGWVVLAPVCGALDWRPHIWITAGAGSGKSAILERYIAPLLGDLSLHVSGNTSEAGLRQTLRADALPVVFDEAESNEKTDQQRMQNVLSLARVASSESRAQTIKGSADGDAQRYAIRSMFCMSSIATALKQGADKSRFAQLTLRNPGDIPKAERIAHWEQLDRDLDRYVTDRVGQRLQARTVAMIPTIRESIKVFTRAAAEIFDSQRLGDQYGALLGGAWSLYSDDVATRDEAYQLIEQNSWESYSQSTELPDEKRCIQMILQHQVRVESDDRICTRTLGELVEIAASRRVDREVTATQAQDSMSRVGLKVDNQRQALLVSNTAGAIAAILRDTAWAQCWATVLARLPGAQRVGSTRFSGAGTVSRAIALQIDGL
jgi:putative DNA primase/helicase